MASANVAVHVGVLLPTVYHYVCARLPLGTPDQVEDVITVPVALGS